MNVSVKKQLVMVFACLMLGILLNQLSLQALDSGQEKLFAEIAGEYELDFGGRIIPFTITLKEGKLFFDAQIAGLEPEEMKPVAGEDMKFSSIDPNGDEVTFTFKKDEAGKITGCTVYIPSRDASAEAVKKD